MKLNKKVIGCVVVAVVAGLWFFSNKASAETVENKSWGISSEVGFYESRIDGGVYTAQDSAYVKLSGDVGVVKPLDLALVGSIEYVDAEQYQLYTTLGTSVCGVYVGVLASSLEDEISDSTLELEASYGLKLDRLDAYVAGSLLEDGEYDLAVGAGTELFSNDSFVLSGGIEYGKTFDYAEDYDYRLAYLQISTVGNYQLFAQLNLLDNELISEDWEDTVDLGLRFTF